MMPPRPPFSFPQLGHDSFESDLATIYKKAGESDARANYLASPPLVVAYAIAGTVRTDMVGKPIAQSADGKDVYLKDIWPTNQEVADMVNASISSWTCFGKVESTP